MNWKHSFAFAFALLPLVLVFLSGCANNHSANIVTLWHQMRPEDRAVLHRLVAEFKVENPGIDVRVLYKETEELRSGLESAVLVGVGPDIVYGPSDVLGVYHKIGALRDMSAWLDEESLAEFDPRAVIRLSDQGGESLVFLGDRIGNHLALVYNRELIPEPPKTTDELLAVAKQFGSDLGDDGRPKKYALVWNYTEPFFIVPFLTGFGGWMFDGEGSNTPALDTPEVVAALDYIDTLRNDLNAMPASADYNTATALFAGGKAAMIINGDWSWQGYLSEEGIDAAVTTLPIVSTTGLPMGPTVAPKGYSLTVATRDGSDPNDIRAKNAVRLIEFLTSEETQREYLVEQKILPSRLALRDHSIFESDATLQASLRQSENGRAMPHIIEMRAVWDGMRPAYQTLMAGKMSAGSAAHEMQRESLNYIDFLKSDIAPDATSLVVKIVGIFAAGFLLWRLRHLPLHLINDVRRSPLVYWLVMPALLLMFVVVIFPLIFNIVLSFSNMSLANFHDWQVVGVQNYVSMVAGNDAGKFWAVFGKTILWTVVNVVCHVAIGVILAVVINGPVRGKSVYRILLILPWAVPAYITALTWRGMFDSEFGTVNHVVNAINEYLPKFIHLPLIDWLAEEWPAFAACVIANVWLGFPFMMVIALGGLQGIPAELYEAARIDRASRWQQFWHITAPLLKPVLLPAATLGAIWTFNNLNVVWLVSNRGEPGDKTHILVSYVYRAVFNLYQYGYGAALSMVIFFILLAFSMLFLQRTRATEAVY